VSKLKCDLFSRIIGLCNNLLSNYQNLFPKCTHWLRRDAGASFGEGGWRGLRTPRIYDFFPCESYLWNSVTAAKIIRYTDLDFQGLLRPPVICWNDATADSDTNNQLTKMHSTHSWIKCVLSSSISYFVVCCFQRKMFNTTKLLNPMVSFVELIMHKWAI